MLWKQLAVTSLLLLCEHRKFQINSAADQMKGLLHSRIYLYSPRGKSQPIAAVLGGLMLFKVLHSRAGWHFMGGFAGRIYFFWGKKKKRIIFKVNSHLNSAEQSLMLCRSTQEHRWLFLQCFAVPLQCMNTERLQPVFHLAQLRTASSCCSPARRRRARPYICCQETDCWQAETT